MSAKKTVMYEPPKPTRLNLVISFSAEGGGKMDPQRGPEPMNTLIRLADAQSTIWRFRLAAARRDRAPV